MDCCGKQRSTKYCPDCGKLLRDESPLGSLREHVRKRMNMQRRRVISWQHRAKTESAKWIELRIASEEKTLEKWTSWLDALDKAIELETSRTSLPQDATD